MPWRSTASGEQLNATTCPVCGLAAGGGWVGLAEHFVAQADVSDARHVMWMNRNVTKHQTPAPQLAGLLEAAIGGGDGPAAGTTVNR